MKILRRRPQVILDLANIYGWISADNPQAAERFVSAVDETFEQIQRHPGVGWERTWRDVRLRGMRSWRVEGFSNFLVFYREEKASIEIYAVLHGARRLERVLRIR